MTKPKGRKIQVTTRALIQRINRKLKPGQEQLRISRSERAERDVGRYYVVDYRQNLVIRDNVDIEKLGRELDVLKAYEEVVDA